MSPAVLRKKAEEEARQQKVIEEAQRRHAEEAREKAKETQTKQRFCCLPKFGLPCGDGRGKSRKRQYDKVPSTEEPARASTAAGASPSSGVGSPAGQGQSKVADASIVPDDGARPHHKRVLPRRGADEREDVALALSAVEARVAQPAATGDNTDSAGAGPSVPTAPGDGAQPHPERVLPPGDVEEAQAVAQALALSAVEARMAQPAATGDNTDSAGAGPSVPTALGDGARPHPEREALAADEQEALAADEQEDFERALALSAVEAWMAQPAATGVGTDSAGAGPSVPTAPGDGAQPHPERVLPPGDVGEASSNSSSVDSAGAGPSQPTAPQHGAGDHEGGNGGRLDEVGFDTDESDGPDFDDVLEPTIVAAGTSAGVGATPSMPTAHEHGESGHEGLGPQECTLLAQPTATSANAMRPPRKGKEKVGPPPSHVLPPADLAGELAAHEKKLNAFKHLVKQMKLGRLHNRDYQPMGNDSSIGVQVTPFRGGVVWPVPATPKSWNDIISLADEVDMTYDGQMYAVPSTCSSLHPCRCTPPAVEVRRRLLVASNAPQGRNPP